ncbi:MAG: hypothetical protein KDC38_21435 [Planctomycetes bacterium]|nr:hypothetical protein [Planctomycetota bacterium]
MVGIPCSMVYGVAMASHAGWTGDRLFAVAIGAVKVPILFFATMLIAVPCFAVTHRILGVGDDFPRVWRGLIDYQLSVALQLCALAPITVVVQLTVGGYRVVQLWSVAVFALVSIQAQGSLRVVYRELPPLPAHRALRRGWIVLYAFVGIQLGWTLRPFFGHPDLPPQLFRAAGGGNAYVEILRVLGQALTGG